MEICICALDWKCHVSFFWTFFWFFRIGKISGPQNQFFRFWVLPTWFSDIFLNWKGEKRDYGQKKLIHHPLYISNPYIKNKFCGPIKKKALKMSKNLYTPHFNLKQHFDQVVGCSCFPCLKKETMSKSTLSKTTIKTTIKKGFSGCFI